MITESDSEFSGNVAMKQRKGTCAKASRTPAVLFKQDQRLWNW
jgi:hypothetical protein